MHHSSRITRYPPISLQNWAVSQLVILEQMYYNSFQTVGAMALLENFCSHKKHDMITLFPNVVLTQIKRQP